MLHLSSYTVSSLEGVLVKILCSKNTADELKINVARENLQYVRTVRIFVSTNDVTTCISNRKVEVHVLFCTSDCTHVSRSNRANLCLRESVEVFDGSNSLRKRLEMTVSVGLVSLGHESPKLQSKVLFLLQMFPVLSALIHSRLLGFFASL